jgi:hypothetical protein
MLTRKEDYNGTNPRIYNFLQDLFLIVVTILYLSRLYQ